MAYLTNEHEAALMATDDFRLQVAAAVRDGSLVAAVEAEIGELA